MSFNTWKFYLSKTECFGTCVRTVAKADKDDIIEYAIMEIIIILSTILIFAIIKLTSSCYFLFTI